MRIKMNHQQVQRDILRIQKKLLRLGRDIKNDSMNKLQESGMIGFNWAYNLAPEYTGALKAAMRWEFSGDEFLIISSHPIGDIPATHIGFDTGLFQGMALKISATRFVPFQPRLKSSIGFMKQTAIFLQQEFADRLKMAISHSIQKVGRKV